MTSTHVPFGRALLFFFGRPPHTSCQVRTLQRERPAAPLPALAVPVGSDGLAVTEGGGLAGGGSLAVAGSGGSAGDGCLAVAESGGLAEGGRLAERAQRVGRRGAGDVQLRGSVGKRPFCVLSVKEG